MLLRLAVHELRYRLGRSSTHLYFGILFALAFLFVQAIGGVFDGFTISVVGSGSNLYVNSPFVTTVIVHTLSLIGVMIVAPFMGQAVYKDFESGMYPLVFTTPVSRFEYLGGRFLGSFVVLVYVFTGIGLGLMAGAAMPWLDGERFGPFRLAYYTQPYLLFVLPNLVFTSGIFFVLAANARKMLPNYVGGVVLLVGYLLAQQFIQDVEQETVAALIDPFGTAAVATLTQYWTLAEQNNSLIPLSGDLLLNRLLWMTVGLAVLVAGCLRFRFAHAASDRRPSRRARRRAAAPAAPPPPLSVPDVQPSFGAGTQLHQYASLTARSFSTVVRDVYFAAIVGAGLLFLVFAASEVGKIYGTTTWPVTYATLEVISGTFALFMLIVVTFYAGELVWRERDLQADGVQDALPVPTWVPFAAKLTALVLVCALLMALVGVVGVLTQAFKGYYRFELGQYAQTLFGLQLVDYVLLSVLALTVHVLVNHKYVGHLLMVLYYVFALFAGGLGLEHNALVFGNTSAAPYSDMNAYGHFVLPHIAFQAYWAALAVVLAALAHLFWVRGRETAPAARLALARQRMGTASFAALGGGGLLFAGLGGVIFYNTDVLNDFRTGYEAEVAAADYERTYKRYESTPQPKLTDVSLDVDLRPETRDVFVDGRFRLVNKTGAPLDSLVLLLNPDADVRRLDLDRPSLLSLDDEDAGFRIYTLDAPLAAGDTLGLSFEFAYETRGFTNNGGATQVVENGTFVNGSALVPRIGYAEGRELSDEDTRRKHDLPPKPRMPALEDTTAYGTNGLSPDADWITFEAVVSTAPDQIALAPGYLQREWTEDGRRHFHYRMDAPILNFYAFLSARYDVARDAWTGPDGEAVAIEVYHHDAHPYNVERMISATKASLDYFTRAFGPYGHRQVRILEFPRYATFAQSFPNTIPFSESIGFIARLDGEEDAIDYPYYVTAHEVAHQWWGHQVVGAGVQGGTMLVETMSQYGALMVMEEAYGRDDMQRFLRYELDSYLTGRGVERRKELPLLRVENQGYIHYRKGSLVMYALRDYLGEDTLNTALGRFVADTRFEEAPYSTSADLLGYIRDVTPDSLAYLLTDLFETITLYENRAVEAVYEERPDGRFDVTLSYEARKVRADSLGNETPVEMADWIDVGVFADEDAAEGDGDDAPLYLAKHRIESGEGSVTVTVDRRPARAGIDPYNKLIDRTIRDNVTDAAPADD